MTRTSKPKPTPEYLTRQVSRFHFSGYPAESIVLKWSRTSWVIQRDEPDAERFTFTPANLSKWEGIKVTQWAV